MSTQGYTTSFVVNQTPEEAFSAINNVRGWWSGEDEGPTSKLGDEFTYRYKDAIGAEDIARMRTFGCSPTFHTRRALTSSVEALANLGAEQERDKASPSRGSPFLNGPRGCLTGARQPSELTAPPVLSRHV